MEEKIKNLRKGLNESLKKAIDKLRNEGTDQETLLCHIKIFNATRDDIIELCESYAKGFITKEDLMKSQYAPIFTEPPTDRTIKSRKLISNNEVKQVTESINLTI